ncbi:MAG: PKD-like domain-containing protein, partial [Bacteroidota bacterium]
MKTNRYTYLLTLLICMYPGISMIAQGVCASSAQAPVYTQDFGTVTSKTATNKVPTGFTTKYQYNTGVADGQYIVTPQVQNAGKADWAKGFDHTSTTTTYANGTYGNMYLVNAGKASSGPVDLFFSTQVDNLCPGSVYSFSAWLVNVNTTTLTVPICGAFGSNGTIPAKVTFNIKNTSGTILQTYTTPDLPLTANNTTAAPNWIQYGFQFTLPAGTTSLVLEMRDALGGQASYCGNDFAVDDILFAACQPTATVTLSTASTICSGTSTTINSSIINSPYSNPAYQWQKSTDAGVTWSNIGTPGTSASNFPIASASVSDAGIYRVVVGPDVSSLSSTTCTTVSNSITLAVNPSPSATIGSNSPVCSGNSLNLTSTPSGGTTPYTYSWSGPNSFTATSQNASIANATTAASGVYSFTVTDAKTCTATVTSNITVNQTPVVAAISNISGSNGACKGSTIQLSNTTIGGTWSSSNTGVATVNNAGLVTITGGGTSTITYTVTNNGCSASVTKTISGASVTMNPDFIECNNGVRSYSNSIANPYYVLYDNTTTASYLWTITDGNGADVTNSVFKNPTNPTSLYPSLQLVKGNTYNVKVAYTSNGITCYASQNIYKEITVADTISGSRDTTVCFGSTSIPLSVRTSAVVTTLTWGTKGTGTFSPNNAASTNYSPSAADKAAGVVTLYVTASTTLNANGSCGTSTATDSMKLRIYPDNIGTNATSVMCSNQSLNFTPTTAIPGSTFSWLSSVSSGSLTGNSASGTGTIIDSLVNLSGTTNGVVVYTITPYAFTPSNISCNGTPFTYTVTVRPKPVVTITNAAATICTGSATNLQISSSIPGSTYSWSSSVISGSVTGNSSNAVASATNTITDVLINASASNAIVRYRITAISPSVCSNTDSTDVLVYGASSTANAGLDQALCNVSTTLLAAVNPGLGAGSWSLISGPSAATFGTPSSPSSTLNGMIAGTYQLKWSVTNGTCAASNDTVVIVNAPLSVGGTVSADATVCAGSNTGTLTASGYTGTIVRWEFSTNNGGAWNTIANTANTYTYTNISVNTLFRVVVQSGTCSSSNSSSVSITVNPATVPGTLSSDATVCAASNSGTLSIAGFTGNILRWESSTNNGTTWSNIANTTANHNYSNLIVTTQYRALVQSGNCNAVYTNAVTISVTPQTVPGTLTASATVCATANAGTLSLTGITGTILNWESSTDNGGSWNNIINTTNTLNFSNLSATTQFRASVQSGVCAALNSNAVTITVLQAVTTANAGIDQVLCNVGSATLAGNTPTSGTGTWTWVSGPSGVSFSNANDPASVVNGLTVGSYQLAWTIANGQCTPSQDLVQITVNPQTVPGSLSASATVCATANAGTLSLTGITGTILNWESSIDNGGSWNNI